jgi:tetratricopeptide (TPR) repeat protein
VEAAEKLRPIGQALLEEILVNSRQDLINANLALMPQDPARLDEARREADVWVAGWPDSYLARAFRGLVAHKAHRPDVAEAWYLESIRMAEEQGTEIPMALHNLGLIYRDREGVGSPRSMELFERAVAFDATHGASWEELARGHAVAGRWEVAADCLRRALAATPGDPRLSRQLAAVLRDRLGRWEEAREVMRRMRRKH